MPIKVVDVEISRPIDTIESLSGYARVLALARLHGTPIGYVELPVERGRCGRDPLIRAITERHGEAIARHLLSDSLANGMGPAGLRIEDLVKVSHPAQRGLLPSVTVSVCTRDRTAGLKRCLDSLALVNYSRLEILVIDNAPSDDSTERLVQDYSSVRYVREPRPGLDWARNRAILEASGEIIAYTDDDVIVDPNWVMSLATVFAEDSNVMAVTGLVVPYELETEAQVLFEKSGGFGRGFERRWYRAGDKKNGRLAGLHGGAGKFGTGANMAYRRCLFSRIGYFDPALDVGTPTLGAGDHDMFFRVIKAGYTLVYEPSALVRHVHRRELEDLRMQLFSWGTGFCAYILSSSLAYPHEALGFLKLGLYWCWRRNVRRLIVSLPCLAPDRKLMLSESLGFVSGMLRYLQACSMAKKVEKQFGPLPDNRACAGDSANPVLKRNSGIAVRVFDLFQRPTALTDVTDYALTRVFLKRGNCLLGNVDIANQGGIISAGEFSDAVVQKLGLRLLPESDAVSAQFVAAKILTTLSRHFGRRQRRSSASSAERPARNDVSVSVVIATYDRPDLLRQCLQSLSGQQTLKLREIIVVDNHPTSRLTPPVVAGFPGVVLVNEPRQGLSYARNAGIVASKGDLIVATDDDVSAPPNWIEKLVAPFARDDVMVVTGNVLPVELETPAQKWFELYGGLQRGFARREADRNWFESFKRHAVPTWKLGATANAAFRASLFSDPQIGLLDETLGPGTPAGGGEDIYLFYKALKAGYTIVYEPEAYVWHEHRRDTASFRRQIYSYSKGHVAYHLTTLMRDRDWRALLQLLVDLPVWHLRRIKGWIAGNRNYPLGLILVEIMGHIAGPLGLWKSRRRVKRDGRSKPYLVPHSYENRPTVGLDQRRRAIVDSSPLV